MTQAPFNEDHPDHLRTVERLQDSQARLAPFAHQVALENVGSGGLKPVRRGVEAVFGVGRRPGRIDTAPPTRNQLAPLLLRQGAHVPTPLDERDPRLVRLGLHLPDLDGEEGQLLALYLSKQVRSQAVSLVVLSTQLKWLPLIGHLGIGFCAIGQGETVTEACARAAACYDLSKVIDAPTQRILWDRSV